MARNTISAEEKRWRAEDDARALRRAQEIQSDPNRVKEAKKIINEQLTDLTKVSNALGATTKRTSSASKPKSQNKKRK